MTQYLDSTSFISTSKSNDYAMLGNYNVSSQTVPQSSLLKLSVAPSNQKYFSAAPSFEQRIDNFRIPMPALTAINLETDVSGYCANTSGPYASVGGCSAPSDSQNTAMNYSRLGSKMTISPY